MTLHIAPYPGLALGAFVSHYPTSLGTLSAGDELAAFLHLDAEAPFRPDEQVRAAVRDLLRGRGYKPTGRGKPASEYLLRAASEGRLSSINAAVDACNVVSLHSGFPISVVDLDRAEPPFRVDVPSEGSEYVFNPTGQSIRLDGLLCLFDAVGPCANAVKDSQRTKTHVGTLRTLSVVWAPRALEERLDKALQWYHALVERTGARTEPVPLDSATA